jgi:hypothetical protein
MKNTSGFQLPVGAAGVAERKNLGYGEIVQMVEDPKRVYVDMSDILNDPVS